MKLQHQMVITLTRCNALVSLSQKRWVNPHLNLLFSILLFPSLSLIPIHPIRAAPIQKRLLQTSSIQTNASPLNSPIQETIQTEVIFSFFFVKCVRSVQYATYLYDFDRTKIQQII